MNFRKSAQAADTAGAAAQLLRRFPATLSAINERVHCSHTAMKPAVLEIFGK
jgi:hypothetical protein